MLLAASAAAGRRQRLGGVFDEPTTGKGGANYDSPLLGQNFDGADFFKELMALAEEQKFRIVPTIAAFMLDGYEKLQDLSVPPFDILTFDPVRKN